MTDMKIVVTRRTDDFRACFDGEPERWACGPTKAAAVGLLILNFGDRRGIAVEMNAGFDPPARDAASRPCSG